MSLNHLILSSKIFIIAITLNACSIQNEYIQPYLELELIDQEISEKKNIINNLETYIKSQKDVLQQPEGKHAINNRTAIKIQALINIENAEKSLEIFKTIIDQLELKQRTLREAVKTVFPKPSNLV